MTSTYAKPFNVPEKLPGVVRGLTREILREVTYQRLRPDEKSLVEFARSYFENYNSDAHQEEEEASPLEPEGDQMAQYILQLFRAADVDKSNSLDKEEFYSVLHVIVMQYGLDARDIEIMMAEADTNHDGTIDYPEFVATITEIVRTLKGYYQSQSDVSEVADAIINGIPLDELQAVVEEMFHYFDKDSNGYLDRAEIGSLFSDPFFGFPDKAKKVIFELIDQNRDDRVSYSEFIPLAIGLIHHYTTIFLNTQLCNQTGTDYFNALYSRCQEIDEQSVGMIPVTTLRGIVQSMNIGLNMVQILSLLSLAEDQEAGMVAYEHWCPMAAVMIAQFISGEIVYPQKSEVYGMEKQEFQQKLQHAFEAADPYHTGTIQMDSLEDLLRQTFPQIPHKDIDILLWSLEWDDSSSASYETLILHAFYILAKIGSESEPEPTEAEAEPAMEEEEEKEEVIEKEMEEEVEKEEVMEKDKDPSPQPKKEEEAVPEPAEEAKESPPQPEEDPVAEPGPNAEATDATEVEVEAAAQPEPEPEEEAPAPADEEVENKEEEPAESAAEVEGGGGGEEESVAAEAVASDATEDGSVASFVDSMRSFDTEDSGVLSAESFRDAVFAASRLHHLDDVFAAIILAECTRLETDNIHYAEYDPIYQQVSGSFSLLDLSGSRSVHGLTVDSLSQIIASALESSSSAESSPSKQLELMLESTFLGFSGSEKRAILALHLNNPDQPLEASSLTSIIQTYSLVREVCPALQVDPESIQDALQSFCVERDSESSGSVAISPFLLALRGLALSLSLAQFVAIVAPLVSAEGTLAYADVLPSVAQSCAEMNNIPAESPVSLTAEMLSGPLAEAVVDLDPSALEILSSLVVEKAPAAADES